MIRPVNKIINILKMETTDRRNFIKKAAAGAAGLAVGNSAMSMSARSYGRIIGANDRLFIGIAGLGRRLGAFIPPIAEIGNNVELLYLCDVMKHQRHRAAERFAKSIKNTPVLENDIRKVIDDPKVDVLINATPDHWHAPGTVLAVAGGKPVWGLPGHVVSAMVVFEKIVKPFINRVRGLENPFPETRGIPARLSRNIPSAQGRVDFVRVRFAEKDNVLLAEPILGKSGLINTMVQADGLIEIDSDTEGLDKDASVTVIPI